MSRRADAQGTRGQKNREGLIVPPFRRTAYRQQPDIFVFFFVFFLEAVFFFAAFFVAIRSSFFD